MASTFPVSAIRVDRARNRVALSHVYRFATQKAQKHASRDMEALLVKNRMAVVKEKLLDLDEQITGTGKDSMAVMDILIDSKKCDSEKKGSLGTFLGPLAEMEESVLALPKDGEGVHRVVDTLPKDGEDNLTLPQEGCRLGVGEPPLPHHMEEADLPLPKSTILAGPFIEEPLPIEETLFNEEGIFEFQYTLFKPTILGYITSGASFPVRFDEHLNDTLLRFSRYDKALSKLVDLKDTPEFA